MFKFIKKLFNSKFDEVHKHDHLWSNWSIVNEYINSIYNEKQVCIETIKVIEQKRTCMTCNYSEFKIEKIITSSVDFNRVGKTNDF